MTGAVLWRQVRLSRLQAAGNLFGNRWFDQIISWKALVTSARFPKATGAGALFHPVRNNGQDSNVLSSQMSNLRRAPRTNCIHSPARSRRHVGSAGNGCSGELGSATLVQFVGIGVDSWPLGVEYEHRVRRVVMAYRLGEKVAASREAIAIRR